MGGTAHALGISDDFTSWLLMNVLTINDNI